MRITSKLTILTNACRAGLFCGAFTFCAFAHNTCSTETFKGAYGFTVTGFVLLLLLSENSASEEVRVLSRSRVSNSSFLTAKAT
jgi:hypothetical protein